MAIDTKPKRFSMLSFGDGSNLSLLPDPDGTIALADRQHLLDCYGGIAFAAGVTLVDPHTATIGPIALSLAANAVVRLRVKRRTGADTHYTMPEGSSLTIRGKL